MTVEDDSLLGKLIVRGMTRDAATWVSRRIRDRRYRDHVALFRAFVRDADFVDGNHHVHRLEQSLAGGVVGRKAAAAPYAAPRRGRPRQSPDQARGRA